MRSTLKRVIGEGVSEELKCKHDLNEVRAMGVKPCEELEDKEK